MSMNDLDDAALYENFPTEDVLLDKSLWTTPILLGNSHRDTQS